MPQIPFPTSVSCSGTSNQRGRDGVPLGAVQWQAYAPPGLQGMIMNWWVLTSAMAMPSLLTSAMLAGSDLRRHRCQSAVHIYGPPIYVLDPPPHPPPPSTHTHSSSSSSSNSSSSKVQRTHRRSKVASVAPGLQQNLEAYCKIFALQTVGP